MKNLEKKKKNQKLAKKRRKVERKRNCCFCSSIPIQADRVSERINQLREILTTIVLIYIDAYLRASQIKSLEDERKI